jgi:hypothetical protein
MTSKKHISLGKKTALISFLIGTLIFGFYFLTSNWLLLFIGYGFIAITGIVNIIVLCLILFKSKEDSENRKRLILTAGIMLINIPIMLFYISITLILIGNMRITFTNSTKNILSDINIVGCESKHISELKPNESKTVWVGITGDCAIYVNFSENEQRKIEAVAGYITQGMGQKMNHNIGGNNALDF